MELNVFCINEYFNIVIVNVINEEVWIFFFFNIYRSLSG